MKNTVFARWFTRFLEEKDLPEAQWELTAPDGTWHLISSEVVKEAILGAPDTEQAAIKVMIVRLDFQNRDINAYFKHLAQALVNNY